MSETDRSEPEHPPGPSALRADQPETTQRCWIEAWEHYRLAFDRAAAARGFETIGEIERKIFNAEYVFLPGRDCACIASITPFPSKSYVIIAYLVGSPAAFAAELEPTLIEMCGANGHEGILVHTDSAPQQAWEVAGYHYSIVTLRKLAIH